MNRQNRQVRAQPGSFETRDENGDIYIEGYFSVFGQNYEIWPGATESIAPGAFSETLGNDIRALVDHETRLVLGRNKSGTLELREDTHGLWGRVKINQSDSDAMNLYERVKRGDVDQCSFGFNILDEETEINGENIHWTIRKVDLHEVSVVTFPAYTDTQVSARKQDLNEIRKRSKEAWAAKTKARLKGE